MFGRVGNTSVVLLATSASEGRLDFIGRASFEPNATDTFTVTVVAIDQSEIENAVTLIQFDGRSESNGNYSFDWAISGTQKNVDTRLAKEPGNLYKSRLGWQSDYWYLKPKMDKHDVGYIATLAIVDEELAGMQSATITTGYYKERTDAFLRVVDTYAGIDYRETDSNLLQNRNWFTGANIEFKNEIRTTLSVLKTSSLESARNSGCI